MEKKILFILSLIAFVLTFVALNDFNEKNKVPDKNVVKKQAQIEKPITLPIPEPSVIVVEEVQEKTVRTKPKALRAKTASRKKIRPVKAYDDKIDEAVIGLLEEGRKISSTAKLSETVAHEILNESKNLKIQ